MHLLGYDILQLVDWEGSFGETCHPCRQDKRPKGSSLFQNFATNLLNYTALLEKTVGYVRNIRLTEDIQ